jgi:hypothetical protein
MLGFGSRVQAGLPLSMQGEKVLLFVLSDTRVEDFE